MARFTQNNEEIAHLIKIERESPVFGILRIKLRNGNILEGVARGTSSGNNFKSGMMAPTAFKSERTIQSIDGSIHTIDVLDMESIADVWDERKQAYVDAGIVTIVETKS